MTDGEVEALFKSALIEQGGEDWAKQVTCKFEGQLTTGQHAGKRIFTCRWPDPLVTEFHVGMALAERDTDLDPAALLERYARPAAIMLFKRTTQQSVSARDVREQ